MLLKIATFSTQRLLDSSALLIWGTVLCYFNFSGRIAAYLHPAFHLASLLSGIALVLLSVVMYRLGGAESCECANPHCKANGEFWKKILAWAVIVLPLLGTVISSPSQFSETAVLNRGVVESMEQMPAIPSGAQGTPWANDPSMDAASYLAKTPEGFIKAETIDLLFAAQELQLRPDFENKEIEILGQYLPNRKAEGTCNKFQLVRLFVMCCAADARPIGVSIQAKNPVAFSEMTWLKIKGKATFPKQGGRVIPLVMANSIEEVPPPQERFVY